MQLRRKEELILDILRQDEMYGLDIVNCSNGSLHRGVVYVHLSRMEKHGLIEGHIEESVERLVDSGRSKVIMPGRRRYRATDKGLELFLRRHHFLPEARIYCLMEGQMPTPDDFDPMGEVSPEDQAYLDRQRSALQRQKDAWEKHPGGDASDVARAKAAEEHRRATMEEAGVTPAEMSKRLGEAPPPVDPAIVASMPGAMAANVPAPVIAGPTTLSFYKAAPVVGVNEIAPKGEQFAPDWKKLKELISSHDGTWEVEHYELPHDVEILLSFFEKGKWKLTPEKLEEMCKAQFGAIVKGGMVFRADPDE